MSLTGELAAGLWGFTRQCLCATCHATYDVAPASWLVQEDGFLEMLDMVT